MRNTPGSWWPLILKYVIQSACFHPVSTYAIFGQMTGRQLSCHLETGHLHWRGWPFDQFRMFQWSPVAINSASYDMAGQALGGAWSQSYNSNDTCQSLQTLPGICLQLLYIKSLMLCLTLNVRGPSYLGLTKSILWLLMPWLLASPEHQQPWYLLCRIGRSLYYSRRKFNYLCHISVEEWHKM